jgi:uncharacterized protein (UPF0261 family)
MPRVVLLGTMDTKGAEYGFVRDRLLAAGVDVLVVDCGILGSPAIAPDITREQVANAAGDSLERLAVAGDRGAAVKSMARGAEAVLGDLHRQGRLDGVMALGGGGGTSLAAEAFRALPLGVPKLIVSTMASGDTSPYVGESDLILAPSVVDVAGVNRISSRVLANAAAAMAGMVNAPPVEPGQSRPLIAAGMFGVTTPAVTESRRLLEAGGYEVLTFHMTGVGGRTLESLVANGLVAGVLDITTTELADELVGGVLSAGPMRLAVTGNPPVPRVVSVGALDMVNFGPRDTVPPRFAGRNLYVHNANVTLMRTTPEECAELGRRLAVRVSALGAPVTVILPLKGISSIAVEGATFFDPAADAALFDAIRGNLDRDRVGVVEIDTDINDPEFAAAAVGELVTLIGSAAEVAVAT